MRKMIKNNVTGDVFNSNMKKTMSIFLVLMLLLSCTAFADETAAPKLTGDVVILFTGDIHCGVDQGFTCVGLKGVKDHLAEKNHVVLVDNGDAIQGDVIGAVSKGEVIINLMNAVGYDVAVPGNHEFDYGMDRFMELTTQQAQFPYVCANFTHNGEMVFPPYVIKEYDGVKVAFVGITTPQTFTSSVPTNFQDENGNYIYGFCEDKTGEKLHAAVQKAVDDARAEGAQYVIALAHLGLAEASAPWTSAELVANTTGIDALLDGHSHSVYSQNDKIQTEYGDTLAVGEMKNKNGETVVMAGCGTKMEAIGYCRIAVDGTVSTGLYRWNFDENAVDFLGLTNDITAVVSEQTDAVYEMLGQVVAHTDVDLIINDPETGVRVIRNNETNLGDLTTDAYRDATGADVAILNAGSIRAELPVGNITMGQIRSCRPFGKYLCMVEATGQQILDALEWTSRDVPGENGGFLQVSGMTYEIHTYIESSAIGDDKGNFVGVTGEYRVKNVMIGNEPLDVNRTYTVASDSFLLKSGGDGTNCFMHDTVLLDEIKQDFETVIDYIVDTLGGNVGEEYADIWGQDRIVIVPEI